MPVGLARAQQDVFNHVESLLVVRAEVGQGAPSVGGETQLAAESFFQTGDILRVPGIQRVIQRCASGDANVSVVL